MTSDARPPEQRAEAWSAVARHYDAFSEEVTQPFAIDAARLVHIGPGTRVLDVAAGTGTFTFAAARRGAKVLATDFAPGMLDVLRRKAAELGLANVETAVMDGQRLDLPDESFDVAASIFGVLFYQDQHRGLAELCRVLVPGGRALVSTWAPPPRGEMMRIFGSAMAAVVPHAAEAAEPPAPPAWAALGDADTFRTRMHDAGFAQAHVVELRHVWVFDDLDRFVATMPKVAPPAVAMFETMSPEQRTTFARAVIDDFRARQAGGPYAVTHEALIAVGTRGA